MYVVIWQKFCKRKEVLLKTGNAKLIENAPRDKFWGIGGKKDGQNILGQILMLVRRQFESDEKIDPVSFDITDHIKVIPKAKKKWNLLW